MNIIYFALFAAAAATPYIMPNQPASVNFGSRIIGGSDVDIGDYNYQASLRRDGSHSCGAVLLSETRGLTAAHCVGSTSTTYSVWYGSSSRTSGGSLISSLTYRQHENYNDGSCTYCNDIAILYFGSSAQFGDSAGAASLASGNDDFAGSECDITGWGRTDDSNNLPDHLQGATTTAVSNSVCSTRNGPIGDGQICVYDNGNSGACNGDSGGPMTCSEGGPVVAGLASWVVASSGNCLTSFASVYTRTSYYNDWIDANL